MRIRLLSATWCLVAAVLTNSYGSVLITYVLAPNRPPVINSVYDIAKEYDAKLVLERGRGYDSVITVNSEENKSQMSCIGKCSQ